MIKWDWPLSERVWPGTFAWAGAFIFVGMLLAAVLDGLTSVPSVVWVSAWLALPFTPIIATATARALHANKNLTDRQIEAVNVYRELPADAKSNLPSNLLDVIREASDKEALQITMKLAVLADKHSKSPNSNASIALEQIDNEIRALGH
jgi:hypothetical protein